MLSPRGFQRLPRLCVVRANRLALAGMCPQGGQHRRFQQLPASASVSPTGFEPVDRAIENLMQDALLPAITLISLGFVIPSRPPVPSCSVPIPLGAAHWGHMQPNQVEPLTDASGQSPQVSPNSREAHGRRMGACALARCDWGVAG